MEEEEEVRGAAPPAVVKRETSDPQPKPAKHRLRRSQPQAVPAHLEA